MAKARRYLDFWPIVINLRAGTSRKATMAEALAYARRQRATRIAAQEEAARPRLRAARSPAHV